MQTDRYTLRKKMAKELKESQRLYKARKEAIPDRKQIIAKQMFEHRPYGMR